MKTQLIINLLAAAALTANSYARDTTGVRNGDEVTDNELIRYSINSPNPTLTLTGTNWQNNGWVGDFEIPEAVIVNGVRMPVTAIGDEAFFYESNRRISGHLTIPSSVIQIGYRAFGYNSITGVSLPDSITVIGKSAFYGCANLSAIQIPPLVKVIEESTFSWCTSLSTVVLNNRLTTIGSQVFSGCSSLKSIVIPSTVTAIGFEAFSPCFNLGTVTFNGRNPQIYNGAASCFDNGSNANLIRIVCRPNAGFELEFSDRGRFRISYSTPFAWFESANGVSIRNNALLSFGALPIGHKGKTINIRLRNTGTKVLKLGRPTIQGSQRASFKIVSPVPSSIAPGNSITLRLRFNPLVRSGLKSTILIKCNDPTKGNLLLRLSGKGL